MPRVAVDVMGGDGGVGVAVRASMNIPASLNIDVVLVGDEGQIRQAAREAGCDDCSLEIVHASSLIEMDEPPLRALRRKDGSSVEVALTQLRDGHVDAVVSAGHSGATFAASVLLLERIGDVRRPGLLVTLPGSQGDVALLDVGANINAGAAELVDLARLGYAFSLASGLRRQPRVALVSNGAESSKGTPLQREAAAALTGLALGYCGFVEGHDLFLGSVDVAVCDGFVGNVLLKGIEGSAERALELLRQGFRERGEFSGVVQEVVAEVERQMCYTHRGGALLVGVNRIVVVAHGRSDEGALAQAICQANGYAEGALIPKMVKHLAPM